MSGRHVMVDAECEWCHQPYKVKRTKFNAGKARFCSKVCSNAWAKAEGAKKWGYENGIPYKSGNHWIVRWYDNTGKTCNTSYPRWWWEMNVGPVPEGMLVICKDGNSENIDPENFMLGTRKEFSEVNAYKHVGVFHSEETKQKLRKNKRVGAELWQLDDVQYNEYPPEFNKSLKTKIRIRDGYRCRICRQSTNSIDGTIHHIDANRHNNSEDNLIYLCRTCHGLVHSEAKVNNPVILAFRSMLYK